jgi:hypothetical protein
MATKEKTAPALLLGLTPASSASFAQRRESERATAPVTKAKGGRNMRSLFLLVPAALIGFLSSIATSTAQPQPAPSYEQKREMCRQEGEFRQNLAGDDLIRFVDQCIAQGAGTSTPTATEPYEAKLQACRNEGTYRQQLSGDALQAFVAKCIGQ